MDPSASNFVMHQRSNSLDRPGLMYPGVPQQGPHSPCPALRAAAAEQMQAQAAPAPSSRAGTHYDPVHGSSSSWWQQNQHRHQHHHPHTVGHNNWQPPLPFTRSPYVFPQAFPGGLLSPPGAPMASGPSPGQSQPVGAHASYHPNYSNSNSHTAAPVHTPPPFNNHRSAFPNLNLIGGTAPGQHSHAAGSGNSAHPEPHAARASGLPALHPFAASLGVNLSSHTPPTTSSSNMAQHAFSSPPDRTSYEEQAAYPADMFHYGHAPPMRDWSPPRELPLPVSINDLPRLSTSTSSLRRPAFGYRLSSPEGSSDEDLESTEHEAGFLEVVTPRNGAGALFGSEERIRAQQLMRGTAPGKRVASRRAIESLQSVEISGLSENERTCVICYNDFGVENPEGINEAPLRLPKCKHVFGDHCIKKWFEESDSCPYCRDKVHSEPQLRQPNVMTLVRNHFGNTSYAQRQARDVANAQVRSGGGPADGARGGAYISPAGDYYDAATAGVYMHRRPEGSSSRASWQSSPGRRSPSNDFNDGRRRTRARHGSLRGSPNSPRPTSYAATSSGGSQLFHRAYNTAQPRPVVRLLDPPDAAGTVDAPMFESGPPRTLLEHASAHHENADVAWDPPRPQLPRGSP